MQPSLAIALWCVFAATLPAAPQDPAPANRIDFVTQVQPILADRCYQCHGVDEQEADLRLDDRASAFGLDGLIVPGKPDDSELVRRIRLPADDSDIMPQDGDPLTGEQIALLAEWIAQGAEWPEGLAVPTARQPDAELVLPELEGDAKVAADRAVAALRARGALALPIAINTSAVEVNFSLLADVRDQDLALLRGLEPVLVWLNLARTSAGDQAIAHLPGFGELRRLNLSGSAVTDAALVHIAKLGKLEYLNLYGTTVSDQGLRHLSGLSTLKRLFLWQSKATDAGAKALAEAIPGVVVDLGRYAEVIAEVAEQTKPINDKCPLTDKPVDPAFTVEHHGQRLGFCCNDCREKFAKNPAEYADKVAQAKGGAPTQSSPAKPVNTDCPVTGKPIDTAQTATHAGKVVGFCCAKCKAKFVEDPAAFASKLTSVKGSDTPPVDPAKPVNTECPVTGKPIDTAQTATHAGKVVGFCCAKCKAKFVEDPAAFASKLRSFQD